MSDLAAAEESRQAFVEAWSPMVGAADPAADLRDLPGIRMIWGDSRCVLGRAATLTGTGLGERALAARLREAAELMRDKPAPGLLWVFEDLLAPDGRRALFEAAGAAGLELAFSSLGEAGDVLPFPEPHHPGLTVERVRTAAQLEAFADLNAVANHLPVEDLREAICRAPELWTTDFHAYLGHADGVPVTAASVLPRAGLLIVIAVATAPGRERRGYGEAITRAALFGAGRATGLRRAALHASRPGALLYPRIGFVPNTPVRVFTTAS